MAGLLTLGLVALIGFLAWRGARRRYEEARVALNRRHRPGAKKAVTLEKDPKTGVYRQTGGED